MGGGRIRVGRVGFPICSRRISRTRRKGSLAIAARLSKLPATMSTPRSARDRRLPLSLEHVVLRAIVDVSAPFRRRIFTSQTGFVTLDRLLARLHANKAELLKVLDRPEIPLHTNGSENDIRCHVTRRNVSGGTRSDLGRECRDAFLALAKTCAKLGITFWDYLGARLTTPGAAIISPLPQLVLAQAKPP